MIMLSIRSVSQFYNPQTTIVFKDWLVAAGEQWLLSGASGSGKTTLLHIMTGILRPSSGQVLVDDTAIYQLSSRSRDQFRGRKIGLVLQQPHLIASLTIGENLKTAQYFAKMPVNDQRIAEVLGELDLGNKKNSYPSELSQGQLQRASIARAILNKPPLLFADEPTASLDNKNADAVVGLLLKLSQSGGTTLIVSTHDDRVKSAFSNEYALDNL